MTILEVSNVTRDYQVKSGFRSRQTLRALRGIDLKVEKGEVLGLVGESGCGKSTLARLLLGVEPPSSGTIAVAGRSIDGYGRLDRAALIQPVFQDPFSSLNPRMTVGSIIAAPLNVRGIGDRRERLQRVRALMDAVGLPPHFAAAFPGQLSGGQRQRVAIARALIGKPEILICDEPTSALDVSVQSQVLNLISRLREELGLTIVLISHNLAAVNHLADRVAVMYLGRILELAETETIFARPRHPYTKALMDAILVPQAGRGLPDLQLGGDLPSPIDPPPGCPFHTRCPKAFAPCPTVVPRVIDDAAGRVICHLHDPAVAKIETAAKVPA